jgi:hypothetical protein
LVVEFSAAEELFAKLFELAQAAANDFDGVCNAVMTSVSTTVGNASGPS